MRLAPIGTRTARSAIACACSTGVCGCLRRVLVDRRVAPEVDLRAVPEVDLRAVVLRAVLPAERPAVVRRAAGLLSVVAASGLLSPPGLLVVAMSSLLP